MTLSIMTSIISLRHLLREDEQLLSCIGLGLKEITCTNRWVSWCTAIRYALYTSTSYSLIPFTAYLYVHHINPGRHNITSYIHTSIFRPDMCTRPGVLQINMFAREHAHKLKHTGEILYVAISPFYAVSWWIVQSLDAPFKIICAIGGRLHDVIGSAVGRWS